MATRKYNRNNKTSKQLIKRANEAKRRFTLVCWLAVIALVTIVIGKHFAQEQMGAPELPADTTEQLQQIAVNDSIANTLVKYKAYTVYFNPKKHLPNATVYELTADETEGNQPRANNFIHDENVKGCAHAWDYSNSGYDRGHMTPAADMKWDAEAMQQSFFMTNICPQNPGLNSNGWSRLEKKIRSWAKRDSSLIVATGPIMGATLGSIGKEVTVPVPEAFFKVVLCMSGKPKGIGFIYRNTDGNRPKGDYVNSIDQVERITGLDFFPSLPDNIEKHVEAEADLSEW